MIARKISLIVLTILLLCVSRTAQRRGTSSGDVRLDLSKERVGHESTKFLAVVGNWSIIEDNSGKRVQPVDGRSWLRGQPSESVAEKAPPTYSAQLEEFINN